MSASVSNKKHCVICDKSGGILTCDGCQESFCGNHVTEHRQELGEELDYILQGHDSLQQELQDPSLSNGSPLLKRVDQWERNSIAKIQTAAKSLRKTLKEVFEQSKKQVSQVSYDVSETLRAARATDDFSENDLVRWKKQLKDLQSEITSPSSAKLILNKNTSIFFLSLDTVQSFNNQLVRSKLISTKTFSSSSDSQERFFETLGPITVEDDGHLARHDGSAWDKVYICGRFSYERGCHTIRFKLEKCEQPYRIFFGCVPSETSLVEDVFKSVESVGWFQDNQVYEHGNCSNDCRKYGYKCTKIQTDDELDLILDCDNKEIRLFHEGLNEIWRLPVNTFFTPLPWKYLMVLGQSQRLR